MVQLKSSLRQTAHCHSNGCLRFSCYLLCFHFSGYSTKDNHRTAKRKLFHSNNLSCTRKIEGEMFWWIFKRAGYKYPMPARTIHWVVFSLSLIVYWISYLRKLHSIAFICVAVECLHRTMHLSANKSNFTGVTFNWCEQKKSKRHSLNYFQILLPPCWMLRFD